MIDTYIAKITSHKSISLILLSAVIIFVFSNSLFSEFVWDDKYMLQKDIFTDWSNVGEIFLTADTVNPDDNISYYRPVTYLTLLFDHQVWQLKPFWYSLENVLLHVSVVLIFYLLITKLFGDKLLAFFSALIFGLHPAVTEAVNFIVGGRNTMLCALFSLLSLLSALHAAEGRRRWAVLSPVLYFLALLAKEQAIVLMPLLILVSFLPGLKKLRVDMKLMAAFLGVTVVYFVIRFQVLGAITSEYGVRLSYERLGLVLYALLGYFRTMLFPAALNIEYVISPVPLWSFKAFAAIAGMGTLIYLAVSRKAADVLRVSSLWLILGFLPISNIIPIPSAPVADRYIYMPLLGACLAAGYGMKWLYTKKAAPTAVIFILCLLFSAVMTYERNNVWNNEESLWKDVVAKSPEKAVGYYNLGVIYQDRGDLEDAAREYRLTLERDPDYLLAHINLGIINYSRGLVEEAVREFRTAIAIDPGFAMAYYNLGRVFQSRRRNKSAVEQYQKALELRPDYPEAHNNLAIIYKTEGFADDAIRHFQAALRSNPGSPNTHNNLGSTYMMKGMLDKAMEHFRIAITLDPTHSQAKSNLRFAETLKAYSIKKK